MEISDSLQASFAASIFGPPPAELVEEDGHFVFRVQVGPRLEIGEEHLEPVRELVGRWREAGKRESAARKAAAAVEAEIAQLHERELVECRSLRSERDVLEAKLEAAKNGVADVAVERKGLVLRIWPAAIEAGKAEEPLLAAFRDDVESYRRAIRAAMKALENLLEAANGNETHLYRRNPHSGVPDHIESELVRQGVPQPSSATS